MPDCPLYTVRGDVTAAKSGAGNKDILVPIVLFQRLWSSIPGLVWRI